MIGKIVREIRFQRSVSSMGITGWTFKMRPMATAGMSRVAVVVQSAMDNNKAFVQ